MSPVIGADISFYQNNIVTPQRIDFVKMRTQAEYVIIRAGQNLWLDRDIKINWSDAKTAGIPRGSYWFFDSRADPKRQADLWLQALGGNLGELPMFLDLEERYGGQFGGWKNWFVFLEYLKTLVGKKEICIYTGYYYFKDNAPNQITQRKELEYFHQYPLWIANYNTTKPAIPLPWSPTEWLFWQFTPKGDGSAYGVESMEIDLNYFNGESVSFRSRFNLSASPPPPPPPPPDPNPTPLPTPPPAMPLKKVLSNGVTYVRDVRQTPRKLMIHVLSIDLDVSKAEFLVTPTSPSTAPNLCAQTTSQFAKTFGVQLAINGDGWTIPVVTKNNCPEGRALLKVNGFAASGGTVYSTASTSATFYVDRKNRVTINNRPNNLIQAISGEHLLATNGKIANNLDISPYNACSAIGTGNHGRKLILMVVDGQQPGYSEGVNLVELANLMIFYGADTAINLNGGGSTTMVTLGPDKLPQVLNSPIADNIQGKEAFVANHLGIITH